MQVALPSLMRIGQFAVFAVSAASIYTAGVLFALPQGIVELGGVAIVRQTLADGLIHGTYSTLVGRAIVFVGLPLYVYLLRPFAHLYICASIGLGRDKVRILKRASKVLRKGDRLYDLAARKTTQGSIFFALAFFAIISVDSVGRLGGILFIPLLPLSLWAMDEEIARRRLRLNFRRKEGRRKEGLLYSSVLTCAAFLIFFIGGARLDKVIDSGSLVDVGVQGVRAALVVSVGEGAIFATKTSDDPGDGPRTWIFLPVLSGPIVIPMKSVPTEN